MVNRYMPSASTNSYQYQGLYGNLSCGFPPDDSFHIFRGIESDYPWPGLTFGLTLLATYYFCTNQVKHLTLEKGSISLQPLCFFVKIQESHPKFIVLCGFFTEFTESYEKIHCRLKDLNQLSPTQQPSTKSPVTKPYMFKGPLKCPQFMHN